MANNKSIQFLRGTLDKKLNSTDTLFPGQPLFVTDTNQLYMGGGQNSEIKSSTPITVEKVVKYDDGRSEIIKIEESNGKIQYEDSTGTFTQSNIRDGEGNSSLIQAFSDEVDNNRYPNQAIAKYSTSLGRSNINKGKYSIMLGNENKNGKYDPNAEVEADTSTDESNTSTDEPDIDEKIQNDTQFQDKTLVTDVNTGANSIVTGMYNTNNAQSAFVTGISNKSYANSSIIGGEYNINNGYCSLVTGTGNGNSSVFSIVGGINNSSKGQASIVSGNKNINTNHCSLLCGKDNESNAPNSLIVGSNNKNLIMYKKDENGKDTLVIQSKGSNSFLACGGNTNYGSYSTLIGDANTNNNYCAFVGGQFSENTGMVSFTYGQQLRTNANFQVNFGAYNKEDNTNALAIGGGWDEKSRKNIFEVKKDGRVKAYGAPKESEDVLRANDTCQIKSWLTTIQHTITPSISWGKLTLDTSCKLQGSVSIKVVISGPYINKTINIPITIDTVIPNYNSSETLTLISKEQDDVIVRFELVSSTIDNVSTNTSINALIFIYVGWKDYLRDAFTGQNYPLMFTSLNSNIVVAEDKTYKDYPVLSSGTIRLGHPDVGYGFTISGTPTNKITEVTASVDGPSQLTSVSKSLTLLNFGVSREI